mmetsp:Transcript_98012/g.305231  ORF Transcript_98012/g.305231 Transcript_98012/m.305231 type:complete len:280 (+) Transcript_98012:590-1429(+)
MAPVPGAGTGGAGEPVRGAPVSEARPAAPLSGTPAGPGRGSSCASSSGRSASSMVFAAASSIVRRRSASSSLAWAPHGAQPRAMRVASAATATAASAASRAGGTLPPSSASRTAQRPASSRSSRPPHSRGRHGRGSQVPASRGSGASCKARSALSRLAAKRPSPGPHESLAPSWPQMSSAAPRSAALCSSRLQRQTRRRWSGGSRTVHGSTSSRGRSKLCMARPNVKIQADAKTRYGKYHRRPAARSNCFAPRARCACSCTLRSRYSASRFGALPLSSS